MKRLQLILRFIAYFLKAKTLYKVHSPFVYNFCENILDDGRQYYAFELLKGMKKELIKNHKKIDVTDFGAGSHLGLSKQRKISSIAKSSVSSNYQAQILFKMVEYYQPKRILEFGTSLGITTLYLALANSKNKVVTLEGCPNISQYARFNFDFAKAPNISIITGEFSQTIPKAFDELEALDFVFFDGNHRKKATLDYFNICLEKAHDNSIFIFDDIYWSTEMVEAWESIKNHPKVTLTIDLYFMGIVFFRKEQKEKEHFILRKYLHIL